MSIFVLDNQVHSEEFAVENIHKTIEDEYFSLVVILPVNTADKLHVTECIVLSIIYVHWKWYFNIAYLFFLLAARADIQLT